MTEDIDTSQSENMVAKRRGRIITLRSLAVPPVNAGRLIFAGEVVAAGASWFEARGRAVEFIKGRWNQQAQLTSVDISPNAQLAEMIQDSMDGIRNLHGCRIGLGLVTTSHGSSRVQFSNTTLPMCHVQFVMAENPTLSGDTYVRRRLSTQAGRWRLPKWLMK